MDAKLLAIEKRYEELGELLSKAETVSDPALFKKLSKERSESEEIVFVWRDLCNVRDRKSVV